MFGVVLMGIIAMSTASAEQWKVYTLSAPWCGESCKQWKSMVDAVAHEFPTITFETVEESTFRVKSASSIMTLPTSFFKYGNEMHEYSYAKTESHLRRWLLDGTRGEFSLIPSTKISLPDRDNMYPCTVTLIGRTKPGYMDALASRLPSVGITWLSTENSVSSAGNSLSLNTSIVRRVDGYVTQEYHHNQNFLHRLLPPIIAYKETKKNLVMEILRGLSFNEIHIVNDGHLASHWLEMARRYPYTAFIHFQPDETDLPSPSVMVYNRSLNFSFPSVGHEVDVWYDDVMSGRVEPDRRVSQFPSTPHPTLFDVTGENAWEWIRESENAYLYVYDENMGTNDCVSAFETLPRNLRAGRMDISCNDHEALPESAKAGMAIWYKNGLIKQVRSCKDFKFFPIPNVSERVVEEL